MLQQTITCTDFNGNEYTEDYFFNLTEAELVDYSISVEGGIEKKLEDIIASSDIQEILKIFKELILLSYGKKSDDGKRFIKNEQLREEFAQTAAYSELYMSFIKDDKKAADFINGILPANRQLTKEQLDQSIEETAEKLGVQKPELSEATPQVEETPSEDKVVDMPTETEEK